MKLDVKKCIVDRLIETRRENIQSDGKSAKCSTGCNPQ